MNNLNKVCVYGGLIAAAVFPVSSLALSIREGFSIFTIKVLIGSVAISVLYTFIAYKAIKKEGWWWPW